MELRSFGKFHHHLLLNNHSCIFKQIIFFLEKLNKSLLCGRSGWSFDGLTNSEVLPPPLTVLGCVSGMHKSHELDPLPNTLFNNE